MPKHDEAMACRHCGDPYIADERQCDCPTDQEVKRITGNPDAMLTERDLDAYFAGYQRAIGLFR